MRCVDCNGCQIGDDCVGYDPSAISGPPDVKTCKLLGIDCSGGADDSSNIWLIFKLLVREKELSLFDNMHKSKFS